jgi:hypothetical protein
MSEDLRAEIERLKAEIAVLKTKPERGALSLKVSGKKRRIVGLRHGPVFRHLVQGAS